MPDGCRSAEPRGVGIHSSLKVVQQRPEWTDVEDGRAGPRLPGHAREEGEHGSFRLAACGGGEEHGVTAGEDGPDRPLLQGPEAAPAQHVDNVVLHDRVERPEPVHGQSSRSIESRSDAAREALSSTSVSSSCDSVRA